MSFTDGAHRVRPARVGAVVLLVATGSVHLAEADTPAADATVPVPLTDATLGQKASAAAWDGDEDPACTGTMANPTAPAGMSCVYLDQAINVTNVRTIPAGALRAFLLTWGEETTNISTVQISWACTAPS